MSDQAKAQKLLARLPRGFGDRGPTDVAATEHMLAKIRETYELYGFEAVETPFIEFTDALGKFLPDQDRPNEGVFSFQDDDEQWLSLRYDLTAPLARYVAENFDVLPKPYRSYRGGWVFRNEKPGPGRFRQFMQFDADTVGAASVAADAEICMMAADTLEHVGIQRGDYVIKVNNRKVLDGVLEAIGLGGEAHVGQRLTVLRAIDKLDKVGADGVRDLLGKGRMDPSGDFTKGAGIEADAIERVLAFTAARGADAVATCDNLDAVVAGSARGAEGVAELREIAALIAAAGYDDGRILIDPSVVRGLEYYTGPVYEAELTFTVQNDEGQTVRFGSVAGGGRYDGLVSRFRGEPVPATGFSIGVSRLLAALKAVGSPLVSAAASRGPVVVLVMDRTEIGHYQKLVATLRQAGIRAELYLGSSGMKAQMKYADRRGSQCVVIQGSDERAKGEVTIKDLILGAELAGAGKDREDYLARQAEAQFAVPEAEIVAAVTKVLARHG
ncbi:MAG: histidine--tRNA ligase [Chelatococcus sp.]|jgi:histidyl-tRNA synthetase|uniref:histidine--tRNA ligase n=1 Tax=unclassified Chelatococcus TaxID=2638111 RepID=UPI001BCE81A9|nr:MULTISPECIES: histidine--tRNA ligase [unclassified Chelatococcus]CAH1649218.1 Histidine--tRNA ligase [Hyphomicrobiales bacterium]MBS7739578.1 histidine--tRNA ligase [Chelatococcus sp. HY11]MBX3537613.1 histidine--tRNA ligase [Chelatococcus sp.]MBX3543947.1 histidine--tRNA ligase [Chelatococcus sp.]MCO5075885.1 histidine--tRNA ligase [Chelatococcus sp.]